MLTSEGCTVCWRRLWESLPEPCDALAITSPESLVYFANYLAPPFVFNTVESSAVLLLWPDRSLLVGDNLVRPYLERSCVDEVTCLEWYSGKASAPPRRAQIAAWLAEQPQLSMSHRLGIESLGPGSLKARPHFVLDPLIRSLRRSKDPDELALIRESVRAGEAAHAAALAGVEPGMTELDVYLLVVAAASRELRRQVLVYGDFVSGPRCATERGGPPTTRDRTRRPLPARFLGHRGRLSR